MVMELRVIKFMKFLKDTLEYKERKSINEKNKIYNNIIYTYYSSV